MNQRRVGQSDLFVSEISLGCWTLGGLNWVNGFPNGWANVDEDDAIAAIHHALDQGVNHFDNADVYGNGRAERLLAKALGKRTNDVVIATKVGHFPGCAEHAYVDLHIRHQCEMSLRNLGRETIDLYYFHHGNFGESDMYLDDAVAMVNRLKEEGKIRHVGLSAYNDNDFQKLVPKIKPVCLQSWANALKDGFIRPGSPVSNLMKEHGLSFVAFSPLAQGLLLGKYSALNAPQFDEGDHRRGKEDFSSVKLAELDPKIEKLKSRFGGATADLCRLALQYDLWHPEVCCVIPGFRDKAQVEMNLAANDQPLSDEDMEFIRETLA